VRESAHIADAENLKVPLTYDDAYEFEKHMSKACVISP
jgi:hypothetical protein